MCGIWTYLTNTTLTNEQIITLKSLFETIKGRGPEDHQFQQVNSNLIVGFHRLKIVDTSDSGNQPFIVTNGTKTYYLICNGEIYNHKQI